MITITEHCKHCSYKFKVDEFSSVCPICCGSRDRYDNLAHQWKCTREEAKEKVLHLQYGKGASLAKEIYNKHGRGVIFEVEK